ncbi:HTH domain-containing protein [Halogeometricum luteum]|uniref:Uncharacterized protein n=1 Tax=Halogeometricum luteum TaxID=2950537 RepID=A0ABU2G357_9EURY|nr:HTH domain-containing protein [Halogeometricum sp. S3BR5-2]MDS0295226.1 hypothetical protein [Halogeometricum sp. S3BR5-2]
MAVHSYHRTVVFVHPADGTADRLVNRLRSLRKRNAIDDLQVFRWEDANRPPPHPGPVVPVDALLEDVAEWADVHGVSLPFATAPRPLGRPDSESPPAVLAEYWNGTLCYVAPHVDDAGLRDVEGYVAAMERRTGHHTRA